MRVVIAGGTGFLGRHLAERLRGCGHEVVVLSRADGPGTSTWDTRAGVVDRDLIARADAVVNLAGATIASNPHAPGWRKRVMDSRVASTSLLAEAIAEAPSPPAFIAGSGISIYGDHGEEAVTEDTSSTGSAALTEVARAWEAAAEPAREAGARVCVLRTAPVLDSDSSPLRQLRTVFRLGLGTRMGSGQQFFPVISLRDWVSAAAFLLESDDVSGAFNMCCPATPTNAEFTRALAAAVHRPAPWAAPAPLLRLAGGPIAPELLGSVNAQPAALHSAGYDFADTDVSEVLAAALG